MYSCSISPCLLPWVWVLSWFSVWRLYYLKPDFLSATKAPLISINSLIFRTFFYSFTEFYLVFLMPYTLLNTNYIVVSKINHNILAHLMAALFLLSLRLIGYYNNYYYRLISNCNSCMTESHRHTQMYKCMHIHT